MSALSHKQKRYLSQLAAQAYALVEHGDADKAAVDQYRHEEVIKAVGKPGLRLCTQDDYADVKAHFQNLIGEPGRALKTAMHGHANDLRVAKWNLQKALRDNGFSDAYGNTISRDQYGKSMAALTDPAQVHRLMVTIKTRGVAKRGTARPRAGKGTIRQDKQDGQDSESHSHPVNPVHPVKTPLLCIVR